MDKYTATEQAFKHGYEKGYAKAKSEIVYCKDCVFAEPNDASDNYVNCRQLFGMAMTKDWYCADGERKKQ